jgi:hypothetical protein
MVFRFGSGRHWPANPNWKLRNIGIIIEIEGSEKDHCVDWYEKARTTSS